MTPEACAFSEALALESASDCRFDANTGVYLLTPAEMVRYAKIVAYKVAYNLRLGYEMDPFDDPLTYVECDGGPE